MEDAARVPERAASTRTTSSITLSGSGRCNVLRLVPRRTTAAGPNSDFQNCFVDGGGHAEENMHGLIYLVGLIVVILAILSFFGLR